MRLVLSILIFYAALLLVVILVADHDWLCGEIRDYVVKACVGSVV